jgi:hypothetical protein
MLQFSRAFKYGGKPDAPLIRRALDSRKIWQIYVILK